MEYWLIIEPVWLSSRRGSYASLIGFNPRGLQARKGTSTHVTDPGAHETFLLLLLLLLTQRTNTMSSVLLCFYYVILLCYYVIIFVHLSSTRSRR